MLETLHHDLALRAAFELNLRWSMLGALERHVTWRGKTLALVGGNAALRGSDRKTVTQLER